MIRAIYPPLLLIILAGVSGYYVFTVLYLGMPFALLDARARYGEYRVLLKAKCPRRITWLIKRMQFSWCGRTAAIAAKPSEARETYEKSGYKWFHIFPVGTPLCFFKIKWWAAAFK